MDIWIRYIERESGTEEDTQREKNTYIYVYINRMNKSKERNTNQ